MFRKHDESDPKCSCDYCFDRCRAATCAHPEHQRRPFVEIPGESPEKRETRRLFSKVSPVELAMMGIV